METLNVFLPPRRLNSAFASILVQNVLPRVNNFLRHLDGGDCGGCGRRRWRVSLFVVRECGVMMLVVRRTQRRDGTAAIDVFPEIFILFSKNSSNPCSILLQSDVQAIQQVIELLRVNVHHRRVNLVHVLRRNDEQILVMVDHDPNDVDHVRPLRHLLLLELVRLDAVENVRCENRRKIRAVHLVTVRQHLTVKRFRVVCGARDSSQEL